MTFFVSALCLSASAQTDSDIIPIPEKNNKYLLPDGKVFAIEKIDSLNKVWGRVLFAHNKEDDAKGIIHLIRMTDEIRKQLESANAKREQAMDFMLNKPAPDFELMDLQGNLWTLSKLRGRIVVLNFWFTSCAPCVQEMPQLNELAGLKDYKNIVFLGLTFNSADQIKTFLKKHNFNYTLLPNSAKIDKQYQISLWPTSIVIDKAGYVKRVFNSSPKIKEDIESVINSLI